MVAKFSSRVLGRHRSEHHDCPVVTYLVHGNTKAFEYAGPPAGLLRNAGHSGDVIVDAGECRPREGEGFRPTNTN
jgi:hypothetical protein